MKVPGLFRPEKNIEVVTDRLLKGSQEPKGVLEYNEFEIVRADTYAKGIAELKRRGLIPFTFAEDVEARIIDYKLNKDNKLFDTWLDSITGISHKAKSTKFKLILRSDKLENIAECFSQSFIPIDYGAEKGIELDSSKGEYNQFLKREEVKSHEFWLAAMNGDKKKLAKYVDLWFDKTGRKEGMGVYLRSNTSSDELRGIALGSGYYSGASCDYDLGGDSRFVSGAQRK